MEGNPEAKQNPTPSTLSLPFTVAKAGMSEPTTNRIAEVLAKHKNTPFFKKQEEKRLQNDQKVKFYLEKLKKVRESPKLLQKLSAACDLEVNAVKKSLDLTRHWIHVDLDMFFVAVEIRDRPDLAEKPVAVGNSVVSTSNYIARGFGVRSAMPTHIARELCPSLIMLDIDMPKYKAASEKFLAIVHEYDPDYESLGMDEAKIEITEYLELNQIEPTRENIEAVMKELRDRIHDEIEITASSGYAANPILAKICSEKNKPNGQYFLPKTEADIMGLVDPLDIRKMPGIGPQSEAILKGLGINTGKDLREKLLDLYILFHEYKRFTEYALMAHGIARVIHDHPAEQKSFSLSRTITATLKQTIIQDLLTNLSQSLSAKLKNRKFLGRSINITIKFQDFKSVGKSMMIPKPTNDGAVILKFALELLGKIQLYTKVRLVGVGASDLQPADVPESPASNVPPKRNSIERYFQKDGRPSGEAEGQRKNSDEAPEISNVAKSGEIPPEDLEELIALDDMLNGALDQTDDEEQPEKPKQEEYNPFGMRRIIQKPESSPSTSTIPRPKPSPSFVPNPPSNDIKQAFFAKPSPKQSAPQAVICPICSAEIQTDGFETRINRHIDECLAKGSESETHSGKSSTKKGTKIRREDHSRDHSQDKYAPKKTTKTTDSLAKARKLEGSINTLRWDAGPKN